jgi:hypothetical protein
LLPVALAGCVSIVALRQRNWRAIGSWAWTLVVFALVLAPWLAYNLIYVHRLTLSPAGGLGRATWEASWQGTWPGRVQADLTRLVEGHVNDDDATLDVLVKQFASEHALPSDPMITYAHHGATSDASDRRPIRASAPSSASRPTRNIGARASRTSHAIDSHALRRVTIGAFVVWRPRFQPIHGHQRHAAIRFAPSGSWWWACWRSRSSASSCCPSPRPLVAAPLAALFAHRVHLPMLAPATPRGCRSVALAIALAEILHRLFQTGDYLP